MYFCQTKQTCSNSFIMLMLQTVREQIESTTRPGDVSSREPKPEQNKKLVKLRHKSLIAKHYKEAIIFCSRFS